MRGDAQPVTGDLDTCPSTQAAALFPVERRKTAPEAEQRAQNAPPTMAPRTTTRTMTRNLTTRRICRKASGLRIQACPLPPLPPSPFTLYHIERKTRIDLRLATHVSWRHDGFNTRNTHN
jgi:hypothetical protein